MRVQRTGGAPGGPSSKIVVSVTRRVAGSYQAATDFVTSLPVSGSSRSHSSETRPSKRDQVARGRLPRIDTARPPGARRSAIAGRSVAAGARAGEQQDRVQGDEREAEGASRPRPGSPPRRRGRPRPSSRRSAAAGLRRRPAAVRGRASRDRCRRPRRAGRPRPAGRASRPRPDRELDDRSADPLRQGAIQVEVAGILGEVEVVEARQRRRARLRVDVAPRSVRRRREPVPRAVRTARPRRRGASPRGREIASSAQRLASIAVDSAQSYGGETSTMSMPASSTRADDPADGPQQLARQHAARLRRARSRRRARDRRRRCRSTGRSRRRRRAPRRSRRR